MGTDFQNEEQYATAEKRYFQFMKVDDFFQDTELFHTIKRMESFQWDEKKQTLVLCLEAEDGSTHYMLIQVITGSIFRVRFHPEKTPEQYAPGNTRAIVMDSFEELIEKNRTESFEVSVLDETDMNATLRFHGSRVDQVIEVHVCKEPFSIQVIKNHQRMNEEETVLFSTPPNGLAYKSSGGLGDYHMIQAVNKPVTAKYVGFGEQGGMQLVKNNTRITYFNYDNMRYRQVYNRGPLEEREPLYHSDPFFIEVNGIPDTDSACGVFIDNPSETLLDMAYYNSSQYRFGIRYGDLDFYVMAGDTCADIIKSFSNITGTARLIPRYALGYHQGCYGYESRNDVEEVVRKYREHHIPLDGIHIDVDIQKNYKTFTIDEDKFPNPGEMFQRLRAQGVKCSTNITPIISNRNGEQYSTYQEGIEKGYFVKDVRFDPENQDGRNYYKYAGGKMYEYDFQDREHNYNSQQPFIGEVYYGNDGAVELGTTGHYPDFNRKEVRDWWGRQYQYLFDCGLEMVWQDMTTPCLRDSRGDMLSFPSRLMIENDYVKKPGDDAPYEQVPVMKIWNLFSYNLHKATYHGLNALPGRENKRNFIIGRGCFTGMQRFAGLWTGDNSSSWEFLKINISQVLALGLTGQALSGQDIGGFERENDWENWADPELVIRWTAMGAFLPWFRNHYIKKGRKLFQEPYEYQYHIQEVPEEVKHIYKSVLPVSKYYIELRYTLMQLFYDAMFENTLNGMPICRALFLTNPGDKALFNDKEVYLNNEFMVRNELLIAPVIEKQSAENSEGKRDIYLPAGNRWYLFTNNRKPLMDVVEGGTTVSEFDASISSDLHHIPYIVPVYVKEGAVIPVVDQEQYVGELNEKGLPAVITLHIYPGAEGAYTMYLDDGISRSSQPEGEASYGVDTAAKGEYREIRITHSSKNGQRNIRIERIHDGYTPKYENYMIAALLHAPSDKAEPIKKVQVNGQTVRLLDNGTMDVLRGTDENCWYYDSVLHTSYIKVMDCAKILDLDVC